MRAFLALTIASFSYAPVALACGSKAQASAPQAQASAPQAQASTSQVQASASQDQASASQDQASASDSTCSTEAPPSGDADFATLQGERASFSVSGMKCGKCSAKVVAALKAVDGVKGAEVDHAAGNAQVVFETAKTDAAALQAAINALGYTATVAAQ